jgi:hypothetical protein
MDLRLEFLRMCVPLPQLVKGVPGYEVPEEIGFFASEVLERRDLRGAVNERLESFHAAAHSREAAFKRLDLVMNYAYYWAARCVFEGLSPSEPREYFLRLYGASTRDEEDIRLATSALQQHILTHVGPDVDHATPLERGAVEVLGDFLRALNAAKHASWEMCRTCVSAAGLPPGGDLENFSAFVETIITSAKPLAPVWINPIGVHFADCAWQAAACAAEYFAPDASYVNREDHDPYHRQWQRAALEILDMLVSLEMPNVTDLEYFQRAVAPSLDHFREIRGVRSLSPNAQFRSRMRAHYGSQG